MISLAIVSSGCQLLITIWSLYRDRAGMHSRWAIPTLTVIATLLAAATCFGAYQQSRTMRSLSANITGGDSFPVVVPQSQSDPVGLIVSNYGEYALSGVMVTISCGYPHQSAREMLGTIASHQSVRMSTALSLAPCASSSGLVVRGRPVADYWIEISTQNGAYVEIAEFAHQARCENWPFRFWVTQIRGVGFDGGKRPKVLKEEDKRLYWAPDDIEQWVGDRQACD